MPDDPTDEPEERKPLGLRVTHAEKLALVHHLEVLRKSGAVASAASASDASIEGPDSASTPPTPPPEEEYVIDTLGARILKSSARLNPETQEWEPIPDEAEETGVGVAGERPEGEEEEKKPKWYVGWQDFARILAKLPLLSNANEREDALRFLMLHKPEERTTTADTFAQRLFRLETKDLTDDERLKLLQMTQRMARGFYMNLVHYSNGLSPFEPEFYNAV